MNKTQITFAGNMVADPELRYSKQGRAVANFTVASTPRIYDFNDGEWKDGETVFNRCTIWGDEAEHVAASFQKGNRVIVVGELSASNWETKEGEKRYGFEVKVDEIGASTKFHVIEKISRGSVKSEDEDDDDTEEEPVKKPTKRTARNRR